VSEDTKTCSKCGQAKPLSDFKTDQRKPDGKASSCRKCNAPVGTLMTPNAALPATVRIFDDRSAQDWAVRITECWRSSVEAIIRAGQLLISAKAALPHGEFGAMCARDLPFSDNTAQRLMAIARDGRLSNPAHVQLLPASWGTLYELTKLSDEEFTSAVAQQVIRPDMLRGEAELIRPLTRAMPPRIAQPMSAAEATANDDDDDDAGEPPRYEALSNAEADPVREAGLSGGSPASPAALPSGGLAIAHQRDTSDEDPREFFPTPPWATRALVDAGRLRAAPHSRHWVAATPIL